MKSVIILLIGLFSLITCQPSNTNKEDLSKKYYSTKVIDNCEYIIYENGMTYGLVHKGNCKFCKEREHKWRLKLTSLPSIK